MVEATEALESGPAVSKVYSAMRMPIVDGDIPPGTRIKIDAVARDLGVSQTPVREALQRLESDDLVVYARGRGYKTTPKLDMQGLRSLFEFRLLTEPWAARAASADSLANPARSLNDELLSFEHLIESGGDVRQAMLVHDSRFHTLIMEAAGNRVLGQAFAQTHCHLHVFRLFPVDVDGTITAAEHRAIWRAIVDCDPAAAESAMAEHIKESFSRSTGAFDVSGMDVNTLAASGRPRVRMVR